MARQPDLFGPLRLERRASIPARSVFNYAGRPLLVVRVVGDDPAAPVIVEELSDAVTLKGQLGLWSADGVSRAMRGRR